MTEMWLALYVNCFSGYPVAEGPFYAKADAIECCNQHNRKIGEVLWQPIKLKEPHYGE